MIQPNLPKVNIINGSFEPIKLIEYNKLTEFLFSETDRLRERWLPNSISLNKRVVAEVHYIEEDIIHHIVGLKVDLKEDGLYVGGENILHIEDGEYSVGYCFKVDQEELALSYPPIRQIYKGTIYSVFLIKEKKGE